MMKFGKPKTLQGKKTLEWNNARERLKKLFLAKGITFCEMCGDDWNETSLGFAHSKKRRHIEDNEIFEVALLCNFKCHMEIERLPEYQMTEKVREIIKNRGWDAMKILR